MDAGAKVGGVSISHPYAFLNMKLRAAHDWHRFGIKPWVLRANQKPPSEKHVFDAASLVAMITEGELAVAAQLAAVWCDHTIAVAIRSEAVTLFGTSTSPGWLEARRQGMFDDHDLIWPTMKTALGIDK